MQLIELIDDSRNIDMTNEVYKYLTIKSNENKLKLTYMNKKFFLDLVRFAEENGESDLQGMKLKLSVRNIADNLGYSKSFAMNSIEKLCKCGVIIRMVGTRSPQPAITIVKKLHLNK